MSTYTITTATGASSSAWAYHVTNTPKFKGMIEINGDADRLKVSRGALIRKEIIETDF